MFMDNIKKLELINVYLHSNNDLSIVRIEEFLEDLQDRDLLNEKGIELRTALWELYIKDLNK